VCFVVNGGRLFFVIKCIFSDILVSADRKPFILDAFIVQLLLFVFGSFFQISDPIGTSYFRVQLRA
jgi:hypothetical protein